MVLSSVGVHNIRKVHLHRLLILCNEATSIAAGVGLASLPIFIRLFTKDVDGSPLCIGAFIITVQFLLLSQYQRRIKDDYLKYVIGRRNVRISAHNLNTTAIVNTEHRHNDAKTLEDYEAHLFSRWTINGLKIRMSMSIMFSWIIATLFADGIVLQVSGGTAIIVIGRYILFIFFSTVLFLVQYEKVIGAYGFPITGPLVFGIVFVFSTSGFVEIISGYSLLGLWSTVMAFFPVLISSSLAFLHYKRGFAAASTHEYKITQGHNIACQVVRDALNIMHDLLLVLHKEAVCETEDDIFIRVSDKDILRSEEIRSAYQSAMNALNNAEFAALWCFGLHVPWTPWGISRITDAKTFVTAVFEATDQFTGILVVNDVNEIRILRPHRVLSDEERMKQKQLYEALAQLLSTCIAVLDDINANSRPDCELWIQKLQSCLECIGKSRAPKHVRLLNLSMRFHVDVGLSSGHYFPDEAYATLYMESIQHALIETGAQIVELVKCRRRRNRDYWKTVQFEGYIIMDIIYILLRIPIFILSPLIHILEIGRNLLLYVCIRCGFHSGNIKNTAYESPKSISYHEYFWAMIYESISPDHLFRKDIMSYMKRYRWAEMELIEARKKGKQNHNTKTLYEVHGGSNSKSYIFSILKIVQIWYATSVRTHALQDALKFVLGVTLGMLPAIIVPVEKWADNYGVLGFWTYETVVLVTAGNLDVTVSILRQVMMKDAAH